MTRKRTYITTALSFAIALALLPGAAFASTDTHHSAAPDWKCFASSISRAISDEGISGSTVMEGFQDSVNDNMSCVTKAMPEHNAQKVNKILSYDPAHIATIGTQEQTGHSICCPSFSCAYADAVMDGTVHDHGYYSCSCCTWTDWGGGDSSFRSVGSDEQLLREAYDQISAGKPTVIHVAWSGGEHWITLIGYENATDPDHLTLSNFIALDPWDGAQLNAGSKYSLYGDGCEHISDR